MIGVRVRVLGNSDEPRNRECPDESCATHQRRKEAAEFTRGQDVSQVTVGRRPNGFLGLSLNDRTIMLP